MRRLTKIMGCTYYVAKTKQLISCKLFAEMLNKEEQVFLRCGFGSMTMNNSEGPYC